MTGYSVVVMQTSWLLKVRQRFGKHMVRILDTLADVPDPRESRRLLTLNIVHQDSHKGIVKVVLKSLWLRGCRVSFVISNFQHDRGRARANLVRAPMASKW